MPHVKFILLILIAFVSSANAAQPKFSLIPTTPTVIKVSPTDIVHVLYQVTNNTKIERILTLLPVTCVTQRITGPQSCAHPFKLASGQSCLLDLEIDGKNCPKSGITSGPVVCKTKHGSDVPDLFLCSQPNKSQTLQVSMTEIPSATISVEPGSLILYAQATGTLTVTNTSSNTANDIEAKFSLKGGGYMEVVSTTCNPPLAPDATCAIVIKNITEHGAPQQVIKVEGTNTNLIDIPVSLNGQMFSFHSITLPPLKAVFGVKNLHAYLLENFNASNMITQCEVDGNYNLAHCKEEVVKSSSISKLARNAINNPNMTGEITFNQAETLLYRIAPANHSLLERCEHDFKDGSAIHCVLMDNQGVGFGNPGDITLNTKESLAYITDEDSVDKVWKCQLDSTGLFKNCTPLLLGNAAGPKSMDILDINEKESIAYITNTRLFKVTKCKINHQGDFIDCYFTGDTQNNSRIVLAHQ